MFNEEGKKKKKEKENKNEKINHHSF